MCGLCMWGGRGVDELSLARPRKEVKGRTQLLVLRAQEACSEAGRGWNWVTTHSEN